MTSQVGFSKEPQRLHAEQQRIERDIVDVAVRHHEAFTHSAEVSQVVAVKVNAARKASSQALQALEKLKSQSGEIVQYGQTWRQEKRTANDALNNHPKLVELLEAPSTLELCIRSEMYLEAVLVIERIGDAVKKYPESATLQAVLEQCMNTLRKMLQHIVGTKLCGSLNVSQAVKTCGFLHQMGIPEKQVRQLFIEQRTVFIEQLLEEARSLAGTPYSYLSKVLGVYKLQVAEVVSQCLACFSSSSSVNSGSPTSPSTGGKAAGGGSSSFRDELHEACQDWATRLVNEYQSYVPQISSSTELHSLAEQTGHCCSLLARVGLDVGTVLSHILSTHVAETVATGFSQCCSSFQTELSTFSWKESTHSRGSAGRRATAPLSKSASDLNLSSSNNQQHGHDGPPHENPPMHLMDYLPLAVALNAICTVCNDVRKSVTAAAVPRCMLSLRQLLEKMVDEIIACNPTPVSAATRASGGGKSAPSSTGDHNPVFCRFAKAFQSEFLPHVLVAVEHTFGGGNGVSSSSTSLLTEFFDGITPTLVSPLKTYVQQANSQDLAEATAAAAAAAAAKEKEDAQKMPRSKPTSTASLDKVASSDGAEAPATEDSKPRPPAGKPKED